MPAPSEYPILLDISKWNNPIDYALLKANGVQGVLVKAGGSQGADRLVEVHSNGVRAAGLILGLYYWVDPLYDGAAQARHFATQINAFQPDLLAADMEQWWADWDKWYQMRFYGLPPNEVPKLSTRQIESVTHNFLVNVETTFPAKPVLLYTNPDFLDTYGSDTRSWINDYPSWLAQWPKTNGTLEKASITWDMLRAQYLPSADTVPYKPSYLRAPTIWQWSGERFTLPGHAGPIDVNWFMGTPSEFFTWLNKTSQPDPIPADYQTRYLKSGTYYLNVRKNASASSSSPILRIIPASETIYVTNDPPKNGTWLKLYGEDGYVNGKFLA